MKLENQSYYYLTQKARITFGLLSIILGLLPILDEEAGVLFISIWSVICMYIGSCLYFSRLYITNESIKLTWSPFVTSMKWSDAIGIKIGYQKNISGRTLYVRLKNNSLAYFTIDQLSQYNFEQICSHFGVDPKDGDYIESEFYTPPQVKKKEVVLTFWRLKVKLDDIFQFLILAYVAIPLYMLLTFHEDNEYSFILSYLIFGIPSIILSFYVNIKWPALFFEVGSSKFKIFTFAIMMAFTIPLFNAPYLSLINRSIGEQKEIIIKSPIINKIFTEKTRKSSASYSFVLEQKNQLGFNYEFTISKDEYFNYTKGDIYTINGKVGCLGIVYR